MSDDPNTAIKVIAHENGEITVQDGRGYPSICKDCRFSGWLYEGQYEGGGVPTNCLFHSGGADTEDGDRIIFSLRQGDYYSKLAYKDARLELEEKWESKFPFCRHKNQNGRCPDFVPAKRLSIFNPLRWFGLEYRTRKMRK